MRRLRRDRDPRRPVDDVTEDAVDEPDEVDEVDAADAADDDVEEREDAEGWSSGRLYVLAGVAAACAVAALIVAGIAFKKADDITSQPPADNLALYDASASGEVEAQVSTGLSRILSFDPQRPEATQAAADEFLRGKARQEFDQLFTVLADRGPKQKLRMTAAVSAASVQTLTEDTATVLVFLDQGTVRGTDGASSTGAAQVVVSAERDGTAWRVVEMDIK